MEQVKKPVTDEERAELAKKLDDDVDNFMEMLAARKKTEPKKEFDLEEWMKEIDNHPAFMTDLKANQNGEYSEAIQALQSMKYDTEGEDIMDTANNHKEEGNKHFKFKKYRWAISAYTEGIKLKVPDRKLNAILYTNRATCHKYLKNYRSAFKDCRIALKFDPSHVKTIARIEEILDKFTPDGAILIDLARTSLKAVGETGNLSEDEIAKAKNMLLKIAKIGMKLEKLEAERRKKIKLETYADDAKKEFLLQKLKKSGVSFWPRINFDDYKSFEWDSLMVDLPGVPVRQCVYYDKEDNSLNWPVLLQYPETGKVDSLTDCPDNVPLEAVFSGPFEHPQEWDPNHKFNIQNVRLFLEIDDFDEEKVVEVFFDQTLSEVLRTNGFVLNHGLPVFLVFTKDYIKEEIEPIEDRKNWYRYKRHH